MVFYLLLNVAAALANGAAMFTASSTFTTCMYGFAMVMFFIAAAINVVSISSGRV